MSENKDKRVVTTDALETLGMIHTRPEKRDAIHLAVEPVTAGQTLCPSERITVIKGVAFGEHAGEPLGIVDPFLTEPVEVGQRFWFVMFPRRVHSLRHVWTHPEFPDTETPETTGDAGLTAKQEAQVWLDDLARRLGFTYDRLMEYAQTWLNTGDYIYDNTERYKGVVEWDGFWRRYELVMGIKVNEDSKGSFFTCSC